jgi:pectate lyase
MFAPYYKTLSIFAALVSFALTAATAFAEPGVRGSVAGPRHRVVVTTDIGGTDPDDYQSMAHLLLYADTVEIEGLVSSPFEREGKDKILEVIDAYARDFPNLRTWSVAYPEPDALHAITKQGGVRPAPYSGLRGATEGSDWIVRCARRDDPRPLHILVWGALEEVAQALHDAPDILPKLRVYYIGGPNKKWGPDAYQYLVDHHPTLWIIEANSTYRGYFLGGDQSGDWGNKSFVARHIAGRGALGEYFAGHLGGSIKMGDTPSLNWLLNGDPADPTSPGWGGRFVRAWDRPQARFERVTTAADRVEIFSIVELVLPIPVGAEITGRPEARLTMGNQTIAAHDDGAGHLRFRFCPRDPKVFAYTITSNVPGIDGLSGEITSVLPTPEIASRPSSRFPNWWTDDPLPSEAEGVHHGARSVSRWRQDYLRDFAARMERCASPAAPSASAPATEDRATGYATVGAALTGGAGGETVTVTTGEQLNEYASTKEPYIIYVSGTLQVSGMDTHVGPNKTIIGLGPDATLKGGGLYLYKASNVIIRNLTIDGSTDDNLGVLYSTNVWIDHCTFKNATDGNMDLSRGSDNITVSWCRFLYDAPQPHALASLIGSSDKETVSSGKLHVTFHHNWFGQNIRERMPSVRWGTVHLFNNYYHAPGNNYCVRVRLHAQARIENNFFEDVRNPWEVYITDPDSPVGKIFASGNVEKNTTWGKDSTKGANSTRIVPGTDEVFTPPYSYALEPAASVPELVTGSAGAGRGPFASNLSSQAAGTAASIP